MSYRIGVDIGGTFTDFVVVDEENLDVYTLKVLSTPDRPGTEVVDGLGLIHSRFGISVSDISYFTHGTTVGVNSVIQRTGARMALFTTKGFEDVLDLARLRMPDFYNLMSRRPEPLITRDFVFPIKERTLFDGAVLGEVDAASVEAAVAQARKQGAEAIVIALLNSYSNGENELAVKKIVASLAPDIPAFCSSEIWPIIREYERTVTSVMHAYVQPNVSRYIASLQQALRDAGVRPDPMLTKSNGGIMTAERGKTDCVQMLLSGTASGVIGASFLAKQAGYDRIISLDIGGTSADVSLISDGRPEFRTGEFVGDFPIYVPTVAVSSIGQGGGSIASVTELGVLMVGPRSAGSRPGPVCYGRGGTEPTVTDAFAALGFLGHQKIGFGAVTVNTEDAKKAIAGLGARLALSVEETAEGIISVAISGMYREMSKVISRQGADPRDFRILAFGGAGSMMACWLDRELGSRGVVVPSSPGTLSAFGGLIADVKNDFIRTLLVDFSQQALPVLTEVMNGLLEKAREWLIADQKHKGEAIFIVSADMRYAGQSFEIEVELDQSQLSKGDHAAIADAFHRRHHQLYGHFDADAKIQIVAVRVVALGDVKKPSFKKVAQAQVEAVPIKTTPIYVDGSWTEAPVYQRADLLAGSSFKSPAIVVQEDTTICIPKGFKGTVDSYGNLLIDQVSHEG